MSENFDKDYQAKNQELRNLQTSLQKMKEDKTPEIVGSKIDAAANEFAGSGKAAFVGDFDLSNFERKFFIRSLISCGFVDKTELMGIAAENPGEENENIDNIFEICLQIMDASAAEEPIFELIRTEENQFKVKNVGFDELASRYHDLYQD